MLRLSPVVCSSIPVSWKSTYATSAINYETSLEGNSQSQSPKDPLDLTFEDPVASFKSKTTWEVLRAYIVYTICSFDFIVENNTKITPQIAFRLKSTTLFSFYESQELKIM
uniref:Uncharacterized protein n=1 Tax=Timema shepardi TaxID=629360 RepID=A0A7R9AYT1_TIMSH|nr:unnamed protein product [Timema shepardi]